VKCIYVSVLLVWTINLSLQYARDKLWGELEPKQDTQSLQFTLTIKTNWLFYCTVATLVAG